MHQNYIVIYSYILCDVQYIYLSNYKQHGSFHRNAGHVLQAFTEKNPATSPYDTYKFGGMAFQEYSPGFPHKKFTLGYAGISY